MKVTISLVTYNGSKYIPFLLVSLKKQTYKDWELIIIDNHSSDDTVLRIRQEAEDLKIKHKLLEQRKNIGFAPGHNNIIKWSESEYVLVLNQDIILEPDWLEEAVKFLDDHIKVGCVGGKLLYWNFELMDKTNIIDSCGFSIDKRYHVEERLQGQGDEDPASKPVFGISGALALYRRQALEQVKVPKRKNSMQFEYFDEDFFAYKEDVDLAWRLRLNAWENYFNSAMVAFHDRSIKRDKGSFKERRLRKGLNKLSYRNHLMMVKKNSFSSTMFKIWPKFLAYEVAKFFYLIALDRSSLKGLYEYLKLRSVVKAKRKYIKQFTTVEAKEIEKWLN